MRASVFDISREKISEDARVVKGTSAPSDCASPVAMAVFPVLLFDRCKKNANKRREKKRWKNAALDLPWGTGNQDGATSNLALFDHLKDNCRGLSSLLLANKALRRGSGLETRGIDAESTDVRMRGDQVQTAKVLGLGNGHYGLVHGGELVEEQTMH